MNKAIHTAIEQKHPMHWEMDPDSVAGRMRLVATTAIYENGNVRTRTLYRTYTAKSADYLSNQIVAEGGKLTGNAPTVLQQRWRENLAQEESSRKLYGGRFA